MADPRLCDICNKDLDSAKNQTIKERGIKNLIASSQERLDEKWLKWHDSKIIELHSSCYYSYICKEKINSAKRRKIDESLLQDQASMSCASSENLTCDAVTFDFVNLCVICGKSCSKDMEKKKKKENRRTVCNVITNPSWKRTLLEACEDPGDDDFLYKVKERIASINDLSAVDAKYHVDCLSTCLNKLELKNQEISGKKPSKYSQQFENLFIAMEEAEKSQWKYGELLHILGSPSPSTFSIKKVLIEKYGENIIFTEGGSSETIITLKENLDQILSAHFKAFLPTKSDEDCKEKILQAAANYIREDIKLLEFDMNSYPASTDFFSSENIEGVIPKSLCFLLESIMFPGKKKIERYSKKVTAIAHSIIAATRPRTFISSLQLSLALYIHANLQSKALINILNKLGYCASYSETTVYEGSAVMSSIPLVQPTEDSFVQFIFDNADYDVATIDGKNTFHYTGGVQCITPKNSVEMDSGIQRCTSISASDISEKHRIPINEYNAPVVNGLTLIEIEDIRKIRPLPSSEVFLLPGEIIWTAGRWLSIPSHPGWNGFMEFHTTNIESTPSKIKYLPFIYLKATDNTALYSAMIFAFKEAQKINQENVFITFDQQLYIKARQILSEVQNKLTPCPYDMSKVFIRLGGFHLLMSFLGCIGKVMDGSGLKEAWYESGIYAEKSIDHMMSGKNYSRSLRANFLTETALLIKIFDECEVNDEEKQQIISLLSLKPQEEDADSTLNVIENSPHTQMFRDNIKTVIKKIESRGNTATLWIQYVKMVSLVRTFIQAERSGNFKLHLSTIIDMIPFFHSCNHYNYAKSAHLYVQDMSKLEEKMNSPEEFEKYTKKGYFTIKRSEKFFNGVSTDMIIEQTLMRSIHNVGGLSHGRSMTESVCTSWLNTLNCITYIMEDLENFCETCNTYSEQHKDFRDSSVKKDLEDFKKLLNWFDDHPPFPVINNLMSIATGVTCGPDVNCHKAEAIGIAGYEEIIPKITSLEDGSTSTIVQKFGSVKLSQENTVSSIAVANGFITISNLKYPINERLLFNRFRLSQPNESEFLRYFQYEICPFPISIFTSACKMRHNEDEIFSVFSSCKVTTNVNDYLIIDGDKLLKAIVWPENTFETICNEYVDFIQKNFGHNCCVIFESNVSTCTHPKIAEHMLSVGTKICSEVFFDSSTIVKKKRDDFLSNYKNKLRFINLLGQFLQNNNIAIKITTTNEDFVKSVADKAEELCEIDKHVTVWSSNAEMLCLLVSRSNDHKKIYFQTSENVIFSIPAIYDKMQELAPLFHVIHALTGCSSTSSFFKITKKNVIKLFCSAKQIVVPLLTMFLTPPYDLNLPELLLYGEQLIIKMYGGTEISLDNLRCTKYIKSLKQKKKTEFDFATLPPTTLAAINHIKRVYWQIQTWMGRLLPPTEWGWNNINDVILIPFTTTNPPVPEDLLGLITCLCKKKCKPTSCTCMKSGLFCTSLCKNCTDDNCDNNVKIIALNENV